MISFLKFVFLLFFTLIDVAILPNFGIFSYLNLTLCYLLFLRFFSKKHFFFYAIFAGLLFDLTSLSKIGFYLIVFFISGLFINWLVKRIDISSNWTASISIISVNLAYSFIVLLLNNLFFLLKLTPIRFSFGKIYFTNLFWQIVLNTICFLVLFNLYKKNYEYNKEKIS